MTKYEILTGIVSELEFLQDIFLNEVMADREMDDIDNKFLEELHVMTGKYNKLSMEVMTKYEILTGIVSDLEFLQYIFLNEVMADREMDDIDNKFLEELHVMTGKYDKLWR